MTVHPSAAPAQGRSERTQVCRRHSVAAFFDLDKTVIAKSSVLAFSKPFLDQGLLTRRTALQGAYAQFLFLLSSANHDQVERMRAHLTNMCTGWDVTQLRAIVAETLHEIVDPLIFAEAADLIADHRLRGHDVVIVSASGEEVVSPIADLLGATYSAATRMAVEDGRFTGGIEFYCYGDGKAEAMRDLAARHGYDLDQCYAYSDSVTDLPMLEAVGNPTVVNPDRTLRRIADENNWQIMHFNNPVSARGRLGDPTRKTVAAAAAVLSSAALAGAVTYASRRRKN